MINDNGDVRNVREEKSPDGSFWASKKKTPRCSLKVKNTASCLPGGCPHDAGPQLCFPQTQLNWPDVWCLLELTEKYACLSRGKVGFFFFPTMVINFVLFKDILIE